MKERLVPIISEFREKLRQGETPHVVDTITEIRYEVLSSNKQDIEGAARILAETFTQGEPTTISLGLTLTDMMPFTIPACKQAAEAGLSIIARNKDGCVVGAVISTDITAPTPELDEDTAEKFAPVLALLEQVDNFLAESAKAPAGKHLHMLMVGVDSEYKGRDIADTVMYLTLALGDASGYQNCIAEATNPISQHICTKMGFERYGGLPYGSFFYKGVKVFSDIDASFQKSIKRGVKCEECQLIVGDISAILAPAGKAAVQAKL